MALTNTGAIAMASALLGDGLVDLFNAANAAIGAGSNSTPFAASQTMLVAESTVGYHLRKAMDPGYPVRDPDSDGSTNKLRFKSTFLTSEANWNWEEWGIMNDVTEDGGTMLCRFVESLGTKPSADVWVFTVDITITA
jgi:hypothetical protein